MSKLNGALQRIDERTAYIQRDVGELKENQKELFRAIKDHSGRIKVIEVERNSFFHKLLRTIGLFR